MKMKSLLFIAAAGIGFAAFATDYTWTGAVNNNWTNVGNWKLTSNNAAVNDYPQTNSDYARFTSPVTVSVDTGSELVVGLIAVHANVGTVTLNGTTGSYLNLNKAASANSSSFMVLAGSKLVVNLPVTTSARIDKWQSGDIEFTADVTSTVNQNPLVLDNGKLTLSGTAAMSLENGDTQIGNYTNGDTATLELKDSASVAAKNIYVTINGSANAAVGHIVQNGAGTAMNVSGGIVLAKTAGHAGVSSYELSAGTLNVGGTLTVGYADTARYVQTGGTSTISKVSLANNSTAMLSGGVMKLGKLSDITVDSGSAFKLAGGTLSLSNETMAAWNWSQSGFEFAPESSVALVGGSSLSIPASCSTYDVGLEIGAGKTVAVAAGAVVAAPVGSTNAWKVTLNEGSVLKLNEATARLAVPLDLTVNGSGKIQMYSASGTFGNRHAGAVIAHRLVVNGVEQAKGRYNGNSSFLDAGTVIPARASIIVPYIWTGAGADDNWDTAANWEGGAVPPSGSPVDISRATAITLNSNVSVSCLVAIPNGVGRKTTVTGSGSISAGSSDGYACCVFVPEGCELVMGVDFKRTSNNSMSLVGGGKLTLTKTVPGTTTGSYPLMLLDGQLALSGVKSIVSYQGSTYNFINHNASTPYTFGEVIIEDGTVISGITRLSEGYVGYPCSVALRQTGGSIACDNFWIQNVNSTTPDGDKIRYLLEGGSLTVSRALYVGGTDQVATGGNASRPGGSFEMSGGTLTCVGIVGGCNQNYVRLWGGVVNLGGNFTTNALASNKIALFNYNPITFYLGGVTIRPTGGQRSLDKGNAYLTGLNGDTVFDLTERDFQFSAGNTVSGPGGLVVDGGTDRALFSSAAFTFAGAITVKGGKMTCYSASSINGPRALVVENSSSVVHFEAGVAGAMEKVVLASAANLSLGNNKTLTTKRLVVSGIEYAAGSHTFGNGSVVVTGAAPASWVVDGVGDLSYEADGTTTTVDAATTLSSLTYDPVATGATNTLTGAALTFEAGANIHVEKGATLVISNNVVFAGKITKTGWGEVVFNGVVASSVTPAADDDSYWLTVREGGATFDGAVTGVRLVTCGAVDGLGVPVITLKENCTVSNYGIVLTAWNAESATACCGETHQEGATVDYSTTIFDDLINNRSNWALTQPRVGGYGRYVLDSGELRGHNSFHLSFVMASNGSLGGTFELVQNGGTFILPQDWMFSRVTSGVKFTYTLNDGRFEFGGTLQAYADPALNIINLNGGTWAAGKSDTIKREAFALTTSGEVTFEVGDGKTLTIADDSRSAASFVKTGEGSLVLDGAFVLNGLDVQAGSATLTEKMQTFATGNADLSLAKIGATLNLDYDGQMPFKTLSVGGIECDTGVYSATKGAPRAKRCLGGTGELYILSGSGPGSVITIR